jgi:PAS domain S-box-containing protein
VPEGRIIVRVKSVAERWGAEAALQAYRTLMEIAREIICTVDLDGCFTSFNAAFTAVTGWPREEWIGRSFDQLVHPDDLALCTAVFEAGLRGEVASSITHRLRMSDGLWLHVESTGTPQLSEGRVVGVLGVVREVTARVRAEEALAQSCRRLEALFDNAPDAIALLDAEYRFLDPNPATCILLGYTREELLGLTVLDVTPPDDLDRAHEIIGRFAASGTFVGDYRLRRKDGTLRDAELRAVANILPGLHMGIARDVTERKRSEADLLESRRRLAEAEEIGQVGSWEWDLASNEITFSDGMDRLSGVLHGEGPRTYESLLSTVHPEDRPYVDQVCRKAAAESADFSFEARVVLPGRHVRFRHVRGRAVRDGVGNVTRMVGVSHDVTERSLDADLKRRLLDRLLSVHEEERTRISRELHDGAGQALVALLVGLRRIEGARTLKEVRLAALRQRALLTQTIDELGRLARGLRPPVLDDLGLEAALRRYADDQSRLLGLRVTVEAALGRRRLPREVEVAFYRLVQEAVANTVRHARAREVRVTLARSRGTARLTVVDDGIGFEVGRALNSRVSFGLHGMVERAQLIGGRAELSSEPGQGATLSVVVPLPRVRPARPAPERPRP